VGESYGSKSSMLSTSVLAQTCSPIGCSGFGAAFAEALVLAGVFAFVAVDLAVVILSTLKNADFAIDRAS